MGYDAVCADMDGQLHPDVKTYDESTTINKQKTHDVYQLNSMKIAGPGRVKIELRGDLSIVKEECCKTWSFSGDIYAIDEMFDFDIRPWRERGWLKELITRLVHYSPGGKDFVMQFIGSRIINENGKCDCK